MKLSIRMIIVLGIITLLSGGVLSILNNWAEPRIEQHRQQRIIDSINQLYPGQPDHKKIASYAENLPIYACYDDAGETIGFAFQARGIGYADEIRLMVGLDRSLEQLTGLFVLEQTETPGLGAQITEDKFQQKFAELELSADEPSIELVDRDPSAGQVEAITGATISSEAVINIINRALPRIRRELAR